MCCGKSYPAKKYFCGQQSVVCPLIEHLLHEIKIMSLKMNYPRTLSSLDSMNLE
jgi:hypothetical protein